MCKGVLPWNRGYTGHIIFITNGFLEKSVPNFPGKYSRIFLLQLFYESDHLKYKNINKKVIKNDYPIIQKYKVVRFFLSEA